jgi:hypothetical protein
MTHDRTHPSLDADAWPRLDFPEVRDTLETLHMWTQVVGKIRLALAPPVNHWWHVALYLTARGLTTSPMPHGSRLFQIDFDFIDDALLIRTWDGATRRLALEQRSVADFHAELMATLRQMDLEVSIWSRPVEVMEAIPFEEDHVHDRYDPDHARRIWRAMAQSVRVFERFRGEFSGKSSPVHFFWGSFDLAVTRFSGRDAPEHPGGFPNLGDRVTREAYSRELTSAGWWPGNEAYPAPAFYAYAYPTPEGLAGAAVEPEQAFFHEALGEFLLPYDAVRGSDDPDGDLLRFLRGTHEAAARLGDWEAAGPAPG